MSPGLKRCDTGASPLKGIVLSSNRDIGASSLKSISAIPRRSTGSSKMSVNSVDEGLGGGKGIQGVLRGTQVRIILLGEICQGGFVGSARNSDGELCRQDNARAESSGTSRCPVSAWWCNRIAAADRTTVFAPPPPPPPPPTPSTPSIHTGAALLMDIWTSQDCNCTASHALSRDTCSKVAAPESLEAFLCPGLLPTTKAGDLLHQGAGLVVTSKS